LPQPINLLIFDLDDTLIQSQIDYDQIRNEIVELFDQSIPSKDISKTPILMLLERLKEVHPEKYPEGYKRVYETEKNASEKAKIMEGAQEIPSLLKKYKIHSVIYTNNSSNTVYQYLAKSKFKFLREFQILTRDDFTKPKPDPEGLIKIVELFQEEQVSQITRESTAYVGDSYIDAIAAHKANIKFIWFKSRDINKKLFPQVFASLSHWDEFESILLDII
jgi:phosphoglycolate phosphatase-like HAD superfamily hydrolase